MSNKAFGARAFRLSQERGPLCAGIDPHGSQLLQWGLDDDLAGAERFALTLVEAVAEKCAFVKPQSAFFERFGSGGVALLERVIAESRRAGALVVLDVKRGDIGSTMAAYAQAYLDPASPLAADAITVSPYLGVGSLQPAFDTAAAHGKGLFVLARTSNPEGKYLQMAKRRDGRSVAQSVIDEVNERNGEAEPMGSFGIVMGATIGACASEGEARLRESTYGITHTTVSQRDSAHDLAQFNGPILVPGMGAQGGRPSDLPRVLGPAAKFAIPSYSRQIAQPGPAAASIRTAVEALQEECRAAMGE
ncbi:orotidine-5'-phosphate decarboxylase [Glycomyces terrestris]|uniref:Orotidine-5'-phosphate decarboxylase n=1 Tax=Glycomyces terrestris TaxID=2493553 RepID=A0A426V1P4_9ACTN|nr:orotidine-5'-phosphate decarboxylase [Glycomyces terrestris]RRS00794.1 orotidine-5'-phosphate decarboxylase [Glycomyces terrestris]